MAHNPSFALVGTLTGPAKRDAVKALFEKLNQDLKTNSLQSQERDAALEELKIYGRDPSFADPIFTKEGIETLTKFAFDSPSETTSRNALRVLCNALFLKAETRQIFVDLGCELKACTKLKSESPEDEFLASRLLLLTTYGTTVDLPKLIDNHDLAASIIQNLSRHAKRLAGGPNANATAADPMPAMALAETLKLVFNVTNFAKSHLASFDGALSHIAAILLDHPPAPASSPLDPPFNLLINPLLNLDLSRPSAQAALYPTTAPSRVTDRLIQLLDLAMKIYTDDQLDQNVSPLLCALSNLYKNAPSPNNNASDSEKSTDDNDVGASIRSQLLPTDEDRKLVLGKTETLPSRLLRNWTNALAPQFRNAVGNLYFDLSGGDAGKFVENVGYGYASGFLFDKGIAMPEEVVRKAGEGSSTAEGPSRPINPITGQFLDEEKFPELPNMTDEEKEREAERLFVLFERLRSTGVVNVENPVAQAYREGRIQELPDDASDSDDLD
ncbi:hypothetical protein VTJ83DRAFT_361 [Remersonia thermophila]|uniref:Uncharacterized protein n=1 Tax=Remersonia thermophila TaxID=72144 RepID=A0ABR4DLF4_9PEZI